MSAASPRLVLASASPRRRALLAAAGLEYVADPADVDETPTPGLDAAGAARELAERKARTVAARHADALVLGADTIVALDGPAGPEFLGKPADARAATAMLARLSGSRHAVVTGLCVVRARDGQAFLDHELTWVVMRPITPAEIAAYAASGEWRDKAGGYAIQETADRFVTELAGGGFDNVVGLPVARALALLRTAGGRGRP